MKIKCITLNLWKEGDLLDRAIKFLQQEDPDIIFLQEVYDGQASHLEKRFRSFEILKQALLLPHRIFSSAFRDISPRLGLDARQGNATFSRFPFLEHKTVFLYGQYQDIYDYQEHPQKFSMLPRIFQCARIVIGQRKIDVFNIHGIWGEDGNDNEDRLKMSQIIIDELQKKERVILAGDFNTNPNTEAMIAIKKHLTDVFGDELSTTFNMMRKTNPGFATAVVDMIFVSSDVRVIRHYCPKVDISDHLPLVAVFDI